MTQTPFKLVRLRRGEKCGVCDHVGWCTRSEDGRVTNCMRVTSPRPTKNGGWIHHLHDEAALPAGPFAHRPPTCGSKGLSRHELTLLLRQFTTAVNPERLVHHAASLGVSEKSLRRLRVGWSEQHRAWTFPMCMTSIDAIAGFRLRFDDGRKLSVRGGKEGLFVPEGLGTEGPLLVCEGPTSCTALLDLGYDAIGRPSCTGGTNLLKDLLRSVRPRRDIVILGDRDEPKPLPNGDTFLPGQDGAFRLAVELMSVTRSLKVLIPPYVKDARAWVQGGATRAVVDAVIRATNYQRRST